MYGVVGPEKAENLYQDTEGIQTPDRGAREPTEFSSVGSQTGRVGLLSRVGFSYHGLIRAKYRDTRVAQLVKKLILGFGSGYDFRVMISRPMLGFVLGVESA